MRCHQLRYSALVVAHLFWICADRAHRAYCIGEMISVRFHKNVWNLLLLLNQLAADILHLMNLLHLLSLVMRVKVSSAHHLCADIAQESSFQIAL
jgi:hypothetical protein